MAVSNGGFIGVTLDPIFEKITTFTSSGNFTPQVSTGTDEVEVLVVSGGGGGGSRAAGGGGGGGVDTITNLEVAADTAYPVVVGGGGAGGVTSGGAGTSGAGDGTTGTTSSFSGTSVTTISTTGGGGGGAGDTRDGLNGASGGGGAGGGDGGLGIAAHTITVYGDAQHSTTQKKIGASSINFDGTGDYIKFNDLERMDFGTGDWTIESWNWMATNTVTAGYEFGTFSSGGMLEMFQGGSPGNIVYYTDTSGSGGSITVTGATEGITLSTWFHTAFVHDSGTGTIYVDGTNRGTFSGTPDIDYSGNRNWAIGAGSTGGSAWTGYKDEFRVSNVARYTSNFTPQTTPFEHDANTILLIHSDTSDGSTTFTDSSEGSIGQEGYAGGDAAPLHTTYYQSAGGGGGGAAAADSTDANTAANGAGGIGYSNAISGTATYYAGGGGGGDHDSLSGKSYVASGGTGGGGDGGGSDASVTAEAGTVNTGGGGGGGAYDGSNLIGGAGGSGIVIVKETAAGNSGIYNMDDVYAYSIDNKW